MTDEEFDDLWGNLVDRKYSDGSAPLTKEENLFYAVNSLSGSVYQSGFIGYFQNTEGPEIFAAHEGLKELNLPDCRSLLEQAQKIILGDRPLPTDSTPIEVLSDSMTEAEYEAASDRLESALCKVQDAFYNCEDDIWTALCGYATQHMLTTPERL